ncbi:hypothetical protein [Bhargavaea beijingensis]|uniref:Lipoprotein n=1 Tax=Bhargavaea beijingensis TaxID=426756 RepID=A0ABX9Z926_9BACL|nr:hypothetical protein [Bhargavaea beijingensis]RSK24132.1 hypothetical protein EJA12_14620 [Bhargavaea beijingensis]
MKRSLFLVGLLAVFLAACNSGNGAESQPISVEKEFEDYRKNVLEPLDERSFEFAEMFNHSASIIDQPEESHRYMEEEVIPFMEETRKIATDAHDGLVNEEIQKLNETTIEYLNLTLDSLHKSAELSAIDVDTVTEETYQKAVKLNEENMELQEKIERTGVEMDRQIDTLVNEQ